MITHNFKSFTWQSLLSDEHNFYLIARHEVTIVNSMVVQIKPMNLSNHEDKISEIDIIGKRLFLDNIEIKDGKIIEGEERPRLLIQPHLYKKCYRTKNYFVALLPLMSREPKLFLPPNVLEEGIDAKRGAIVYNLTNGQYKFLKSLGSHIAMTLDESMIAIVHAVSINRSQYDVEFKIFDNPLV